MRDDAVLRRALPLDRGLGPRERPMILDMKILLEQHISLQTVETDKCISRCTCLHTHITPDDNTV